MTGFILFIICIIAGIVIYKSAFSKNNKNIQYLFFDTETTGLPKRYDVSTSNVKNWPRLVQLSWILTDNIGNELETKDFIIKPNGFTIPEKTSKIHGITTEIANEQGKDIKEVLDQFMEIVHRKDVVLVGHNVSFDINIIGAELYRLYNIDTISYKPYICTMKSSVNFCKIPGYYDDYKWPRLNELHYILFNTDFDNAHNSLADVTATKKCFWKLKELGVL